MPAAAALADRLGAGLLVLVRDKDLPRAARAALAERLLRAVDGSGAGVLVGDDLALAAALGVGVHLGERGPSVGEARAALPGARVGVSRHDAAGLLGCGADLATLSPVRSSPGKGPALGWSAFSAALPGDLPVFALGGLGPDDAIAAAEAGAAGIAAIRSAWSEPAARWEAALREAQFAASVSLATRMAIASSLSSA